MSNWGEGVPCSWQDAARCEECGIEGRLMCHFESKDMASFFMNVLPFAVTAIGGVIVAGYGRIKRRTHV